MAEAPHLPDPEAAAIVIAKAPRPGLCKTRLEPVLGRDGCVRLQEILIRRATAWAAAVATPYLAFTPADARDQMAALAPAGTRLIEQAEGDLGDRLAAVTAAVLEEHGGPVVLIGVDTPQLTPARGAAALADLHDGIEVTIGPADDGGFYLIGLRRPRPEVFAIAAETWGGPTVLEQVLDTAVRAELDMGMLRAERDLDDATDVRAFLADPLMPREVTDLLRHATQGSPE